MKNVSVILILLLISSCTITKRVHNPGWHVEWKGKLSADKNQAIQNEVLSNEQVNINEQAHLNVENQQSFNEKHESYEMESGAVVSTSVDAHLTESTATKNSIENKDQLEKDAKNSLISEDETSEIDDRELNPLIRNSLVLSIASILCLLLISFGLGMFLLFLLLSLIAGIMALIGYSQVKKEPNRWKGEGLAVLIFIFGIIEVLIIPIMLVVLLVAIINGIKNFKWDGDFSFM